MLFGLLVEARGFLPLAPAFVVRRQTPITVVEVQVNFGLRLSHVTQAHDPEHSVGDDEVTAQFPRPIVGMRGRSCSQGSTCRSNTPTSLLNHADDPRPSDRLADDTGDTPEICSMTCPTCWAKHTSPTAAIACYESANGPIPTRDDCTRGPIADVECDRTGGPRRPAPGD